MVRFWVSFILLTPAFAARAETGGETDKDTVSPTAAEDSLPPVPRESATAAAGGATTPAASTATTEIETRQPSLVFERDAESITSDGTTTSGPLGEVVWTTLSALVVVLGCLGLVFWFLRRRFGLVESNAWIQVLARTPLGPKQEVIVLRCGGRVLIVGATGEHLNTLAEFDTEEGLDQCNSLPRDALPEESETATACPTEPAVLRDASPRRLGSQASPAEWEQGQLTPVTHELRHELKKMVHRVARLGEWRHE